MGPQIPLRVVIVGAGPVGLCNARTLLDDGFDVTIVTAVRPGRPSWLLF
jgi:2-polyprenyl-6-methoxyphenol hydroxylase-like FAD-dependent oxidoreductase